MSFTLRQLRRIACVLVGAVALGTSLYSFAQTYPNRPLKMVVGYAAGGGTDIIARLMAQHLSARLGQPVIVENKPGSGGNIASEIVAKALPDGYTLLMAANTVTINPYLYKKLDFDVAKDLRGVAMIATAPIVVVTHPSLPVHSVAELIAYAKQHPGKISYGTPGVGTPHHLATELFKSMTATDLVHIPYKGASPALSDLVGGQIQLMFAAINSAQPLIKSGKLRALAVADAQRVASLKELPTVAEAGVPGYEVGIWYGIMAPAQTPNDIVTRLNQELRRVVASPEVTERMAGQGYESAIGTPEAMDATVKTDLDKWRTVVKTAGITPE